MIRKLIQLSPSTAVVSLPSSWIKTNNLKKGASLSVEEKENNIIISAKEKKESEEITLDLARIKGKLMWATIDAAYVAGYDSIIMLTKDQEQSSLMTKVVHYFPGMMIYEERNNKVHFKAIAENTEGDIDKILSRIFNLNIAMIEDSLDAIKIKNWKVLSHMKHRDYNINSYISYCLRNINKFGYAKFSKTGVIHTYLKVLEMLSDKFAALFVSIGKNEVELKPREKTITFILGMYKHLHRMHFGFSQDKLIEFDEERQKLA